MKQKLVEFNEFLENKKIAVIGAGVSNVPLIQILYESELDVTVFDKKDDEI